MTGGSPTSTRWARGGQDNDGYGEEFDRMVSAGEDVEGEARLADVLCPRGSRVLDVGAGMGRVGAALARRGHRVLAIEPDRSLAGQARRTYPDLHLLELDVLGLDAGVLRANDAPPSFDLVVAVGNVMIFLAEDTEVAVLSRLASLLAPDGRALIGFHPADGPTTSRDYPPEAFVADAAAAGLRVDARFGSYELHPPAADYTVWVLSRAAEADRTPTGVGHATWASSPVGRTGADGPR